MKHLDYTRFNVLRQEPVSYEELDYYFHHEKNKTILEKMKKESSKTELLFNRLLYYNYRYFL